MTETPLNLGWIANFIWGIADDVLRDVYVRGKYRDVILPMTVIRRLDVLLEPTKPDVLKMKAQLDAADVANQHAALCQTAREAFYNTSKFTLRDLKARTRQQQLKADFEAYLDGFSPNVQEILEKFKFRNQLATLVDADILGSLIEKFLDPAINLSPNPVLDAHGNVRLPAPDSKLRDTEQVPLLEPDGVAAFVRREVLPYVPDAWVDQDATKIGYEISFTRYFYKPQPLRTLEEIRAEIEALERETEGLLSDIIR
nr:type I restriction-modification system subunit M N-terminal domain-containing protein [Candidatus Chloroploca sp. Khr17]